jgi:1-acyl-sn-glycerol-3-phosphate acyltransferase
MMYWLIRGFLGLILRLVYRVRVVGDNRLDGIGGCIAYSNHSSYLDPIVIGCSLKRQVCFMAKKELFETPVIGFFVKRLKAFPVRRGEPDLSAVKTAMRVLKSGEVLGIFPEGTRNKGEGFLDAEPGLSMLAIKSRVPVVPMAVVSNYRIFKPITLIIGRPVYLDQYYDKKHSVQEYKAISNGLMEQVKALMDNSLQGV